MTGTLCLKLWHIRVPALLNRPLESTTLQRPPGGRIWVVIPPSRMLRPGAPIALSVGQLLPQERDQRIQAVEATPLPLVQDFLHRESPLARSTRIRPSFLPAAH